MIRIFLLVLFINLSLTIEHWFIFDQYQFPGFYTPLFTLSSSSNKYLSFSLSTYDHSIIVDIYMKNSNETIKQQEQTIKLNIERADLLLNTINHMFFIVIRNEIKFETYVNCKLIDSYTFSSFNNNSYFKLLNITDHIQYYKISSINEYTQQEIFDIFSCKKINSNKTLLIEQSLIPKMQYIINKIQQISFIHSLNSLTIIYKPNIDKNNFNNQTFHTILNISQYKFSIQYYPNEYFFKIIFNNENSNEFILNINKLYDRILSLNNNLIIFLHITSTMITCYVNCELTDQEYFIKSINIENIIQNLTNNNNNNQYEYNHQSTIILFNKTIDQIGEKFFCLKLNKNNQELLLTNKYTLRKFTNTLDMLIRNLDSSTHNQYNDTIYSLIAPLRTTIQNVSMVNIPSINSFGSLKASSSNLNIERSLIVNENIKKSLMSCQSDHCICPKGLFWSSKLHRCTICHDLLIDNHCFRLSNHKLPWYEANDYCQDNNTNNQNQEYTMKLASNINYTVIQDIKQSFLHDSNHEQIDYMYWIGATNRFNTRKLHQFNSRNKRQISKIIFRWYDNSQIAPFNIPNIWCSQIDSMNLKTINGSQLCVSITSCGLYADDCQRNYRFICQAV